MIAAVRQLFSELADLPAADRERILIGRRIPAEVCAELKSLLEHDASASGVTGLVTQVMDQMLIDVGGSHCGQYRLIRRIGTGGMGDVYLARRDDGEVDQQVAVKLLRADADRPGWRERFLRERQLLASLNHPAIARLMDAGHTAAGQPYFVMEFVEGVPVDKYASGLDLRGRLELFLRICSAISHAHSHSVIHRDLKPSNILVDSGGTPKLLDFGIAKVVEEAADQTGTVDRMFTPGYASPEQIRGEVQTIATDVFSLGAVLYQLITGRPPRERWSPGTREHREEDVTLPSRLNPGLPRDLDYVVLKALRYEPAARYSSVEALADDIRSFLDCRPVEARSGESIYRIRRLLPRKRTIAAAVGIAAAIVLVAAGLARTQRISAENRLVRARHLAGTVLAVNEAGDIHGSSPARYQLVSSSKDYLEELLNETRGDRGLTLAVGRAYAVLARAQGLSLAAPVGHVAKAEDSLRQAATLVEPLLTSDPDNRETLLAAARISHDRMVAAETNHRKEEALTEARKAAGRLDIVLRLGGLSAAQLDAVSEYLYQIAVTHKNLRRFNDAVDYSRRCIEVSKSLPDGALSVGMCLSIMADLYRVTGDLNRAGETITEARVEFERAIFPNDIARRSSWITLLWREGKILGAANGLGLNRSSDAIAVLQEAFHLIDDWTRNDANGVHSRLYFASIGRELGELLRNRHPEKALAVYDHSLLRIRAVSGNNDEARRGEAVLLAGSAYALRRLGRTGEAERRLDSSFRVLEELGASRMSRTPRNTTLETLLRARGDHYAETGEWRRAVETYEELLARLEAAKLDPRHDLRDAFAVSGTYSSLAALYRRDGMPEKAAALSSRYVALWREWESRLPNKAVAQRQLEIAGAQPAPPLKNF